jgi:hypothetical protein
VAEIELAALAKQCLGGRVPNEAVLGRRIKAWEADRNQRTVRTNWQFTTADARIKLRRLYPQVES